jgi:hypothetical protein
MVLSPLKMNINQGRFRTKILPPSSGAMAPSRPQKLLEHAHMHKQLRMRQQEGFYGDASFLSSS